MHVHWGRAQVKAGEAHRLESFSVEELEGVGQIPTPSGVVGADAVAAALLVKSDPNLVSDPLKDRSVSRILLLVGF